MGVGHTVLAVHITLCCCGTNQLYILMRNFKKPCLWGGAGTATGVTENGDKDF